MKQRPLHGGPRGGDFDTPASHLWVGNLPPDISEPYLTDIFAKHGPLDGITAYPSRGYAFVYFKRVEDAIAAKNHLQGFLLKGSNPLKIQFARLGKPSKHVWVGGFSSSVTKEMLEEELSKFGKLEEFKFFRDRNTALVDFVRVEDAAAAVKDLNRAEICGDRIRVDFLRSHPGRRDQPDLPDMGSMPFRGMGAGDLSWNNPDAMRSYPEPAYSGHKRPHTLQPGLGRKEGQPSKVLWVGYPPSVVIDEEMLHNAMILYGEIERITCFRGRHYSFVEFRSVEEARRAKEALQGRLFNDPRISIMYSNSDIGPAKDFGAPHPGFGGPGPEIFGNEVPFRPPLMDIFPPSRGMAPNSAPNSFRGPLAPNGVRGPRPFGPRGSFDPMTPSSDLNDPSMGAPLGLNRRQLSPTPAAGLLPTPGTGRTSHKTTGWDVIDPNQPARPLKRSRVDSQTSYPSPTIGKGDEYDKPYGGGSLPSSVHADNVLSPPADMRVSKGHAAHSDEDLVWRGVIAKGGTTVCHARCIAIGKGLECELPEVVNCSARTGLDMLTKHYASAIGFDIVFFLPDSEDDFPNYTEFLRYLGSKNRAGVAKLDDGTTLFLVPPSEFLTDVLKVPGRERLYGVVLKLPQQVHQPLPPPVTHIERQLVPPTPTHEYVYPKRELAAQVDYPRSAPLETGAPRAHFQTGPSQDQSTVSVLTSKPEPTLTPELIATLASMLPRNSQPPVAQPTQPQQQPSTSSSAGFSLPVGTHGWSQLPQMADQNVQLSQQFGGHMYPHAQLPSNVQSYPSNSNPSLPMQNPVYNHQEQASVPSKPPTGHPGPPQIQQFVPSSQAPQPHNYEAPHNNQKGYGMAHGAAPGSYGVADVQQPKNLVSYASQFHGATPLPANVLPSSAGNVKAELVNQSEGNQPMQSGVGQSSEVEVVKNQRYQSTLQFAANLLLQIQQQQQQQQQQQASSHMGNQQ